MVAPQHQTQVTQGNNKSNPALCGISSAFNNQTTPPPVQPYPGHAQQQPHRSNPRPPFQGPNHATNSQQQAYAVRLAKERQLLQQQKYLQQQQQIAASNALMPHVQAQSQLPISSSPLQNSSQVQPPNSSQHEPLSPATASSALGPMSSQHQQHKLHQLQHGLSRNPVANGLTNQAGKQRQRQPSQQQQQYQQSGRQHPNQRHNVPPQQQAKLLKGIGRGNMLVRQNLSADPSHLNGLSLPAGSQTGEKGDQIMHMIQGQSFYPGSVLNPSQPSQPSGHAHSVNHLQLQQKLRSGSPTTSPKLLQISSDASAQVQVSPVSSGQMLSPTQPAVIVSNHHQLQLQSNKINQTQSNIQRMLPQNCQVHSESSSKSQSDPTQVDQTPENSASQISTSSTMSQGYMDSSSLVPAVTTVSSQWKTSETPYDSNIDNQAPKVSSLGSAPVGNSTGSEQPTVSQGIDPRLVCSTSNAHNNGAQRQQQQQQPQPLQQSSPQEQHKQQQQQEHELHSPTSLASQHQPQQHMKHPQSGQSSLFIHSPNSKEE